MGFSEEGTPPWDNKAKPDAEQPVFDQRDRRATAGGGAPFRWLAFEAENSPTLFTTLIRTVQGL